MMFHIRGKSGSEAIINPDNIASVLDGGNNASNLIISMIDNSKIIIRDDKKLLGKIVDFLDRYRSSTAEIKHFDVDGIIDIVYNNDWS